ncbi:trypsin-like peptidase domain-containing protein [Pseudorhodoplanes sp.]|uniref:trypsin-like peptidase domain-containing protein n=1 Tax=Pseudorhodoplanes sp. TaxID=1934341 RepID=UPI00391C7A68
MAGAAERFEDGRGPAGASSKLYSEPSAVQGLRDFTKLVDGKSPDPLYAGNAFRNFLGDPVAVELFQQRATNDTIPEVVIDKPNFLPSVFLRLGYKRSLAVCRIIIARGIDYDGVSRPDGWKGTGFLVGPRLLLTNNHVLNSIEVARESVCQFNYLVGPNGKAEAHMEFRLAADELYLTSPYKNGLDYTFVAIEPGAAQNFGTVELERAAYVAHPGTFANIIQHPDGRPQEIVIHDNEIVSDDGTLLHYLSDTDYGSSGSPVFDNTWRLVALHHARAPNKNGLRIDQNQPPRFLNEGIKISTIATDLEQRASREGLAGAASQVLKEFKGINSISGFFGTLGRVSGSAAQSGPEIVVDLYKGTESDIDVAFWNVEWFSNRYREKVNDVATIVADFNLDIWALSESSPAAAEELVKVLKRQYGLDFAVAHSEPGASTGKQTTSVLWNIKTVTGKREEWPAEIKDWFTVNSRDFDDSMLEAVHGRVFDRYPGLFSFKVKNSAKPFDFFLVPLHLKAMDEGSLRRNMASKILAAAIHWMIEKEYDSDWIVGGDYNAEISSGDFAPLAYKDFVAMSAEDEGNGAITYVKGRFKSLIDHIYLSPNLARQYGSKDFFIVAADQRIPDYVKLISDHRLFLAGLLVGNGNPSRHEEQRDVRWDARRSVPKALRATLDQMNQQPKSGTTKRASSKSRPAAPARKKRKAKAKTRR